ncbi:MAG: hypothetical protein RJA22_2719 [Verrucomicrobiota bacterium]|jgi:uncharacterized surface protein with fasciclin (FAS1) repeats
MKFIKPLCAIALVAATTLTATAKPGWAGAAKPGTSSIVQLVLANDGEFDVIQAAVIRAGLVNALDNGQYTVFAPTDAAFVTFLGAADEAAAIATVNSLPVNDLTTLLLFHIIEGRHHSRSVLAAPEYETLSGIILKRSQITAAGIAAANISASNGIVHALNGVLVPGAAPARAAR